MASIILLTPRLPPSPLPTVPSRQVPSPSPGHRQDPTLSQKEIHQQHHIALPNYLHGHHTTFQGFPHIFSFFKSFFLPYQPRVPYRPKKPFTLNAERTNIVKKMKSSDAKRKSKVEAFDVSPKTTAPDDTTDKVGGKLFTAVLPPVLDNVPELNQREETAEHVGNKTVSVAISDHKSLLNTTQTAVKSTLPNIVNTSLSPYPIERLTEIGNTSINTTNKIPIASTTSTKHATHSPKIFKNPTETLPTISTLKALNTQKEVPTPIVEQSLNEFDLDNEDFSFSKDNGSGDYTTQLHSTTITSNRQTTHRSKATLQQNATTRRTRTTTRPTTTTPWSTTTSTRPTTTITPTITTPRWITTSLRTPTTARRIATTSRRTATTTGKITTRITTTRRTTTSTTLPQVRTIYNNTPVHEFQYESNDYLDYPDYPSHSPDYTQDYQDYQDEDEDTVDSRDYSPDYSDYSPVSSSCPSSLSLCVSSCSPVLQIQQRAYKLCVNECLDRCT